MCGAPFSIFELQEMDDREWEEDILQPLKKSGFVGSLRARLIMKLMRGHELIVGGPTDNEE